MKNYLVVDNWFSETEKLKVLDELDYTRQHNSHRTEGRHGAIVNNNTLAKCNRILPKQDYFNNSSISHLMTKMQTQGFHQKVKNAFANSGTALGEQFSETNRSNTIINYYENNDEYETHYDVFQFTALIWLFKEPQMFEGGDLTFPKIDRTVKCVNNRLVLFPCFYYHKVSKISMKTKKEGFGRYSLTHFFYRTQD